MKGRLILSDGTTFSGLSFGSPVSVSGEIVFNTGMMGYPESLTDPSYFGQILVLTYPLIGNYGIPPKKFFESKKIQIKALIVQNYIYNYSHFEAEQSLGLWLAKEGIPAIYGVDTRALTTKLRYQGVMLGKLEFSDKLANFYDPNKENVLPYVSTQKVESFGGGKKSIVLIDCGAKENIIRSLVKRQVKVITVPWGYNPLDEKINFNGVLVSNGPGDPKNAVTTINTIKKLMDKNIPTFGICLGSQIIALAAGANTYKLKFGHRGQNQPVEDVISKKAIITSQNHGFAVDMNSLDDGWVPWFSNLNDGTNEGIRHKRRPFMAVQFHPEASPGPADAEYLFDEFLNHV